VTDVDVVFYGSVALVALAALGLWLLRDGTRISNWLDREIAGSGHLPQPNTVAPITQEWFA
jgi:hypothetical protein